MIISFNKNGSTVLIAKNYLSERELTLITYQEKII